MGITAWIILFFIQQGIMTSAETGRNNPDVCTQVSIENKTMDRFFSVKKQLNILPISHLALIQMASVNETLRHLLSHRRKPPGVTLYETQVCTSYDIEGMRCRYESLKLLQLQGIRPLNVISPKKTQFPVCGIGTGESGCGSLGNLTSSCGTISYETSGTAGIRSCKWIIHVEDGQQVMLNIKYINIRYCGGQCLCDSLTIYEQSDDTDENRIFCGKITELALVTGSSRVMIKLYINDSLPMQNFLINYQARPLADLKIRLPVKLTANNGTFKIPSASPVMVEKDHVIFGWQIRIAEGKRINLTWELNCSCPYGIHVIVAVYEGPFEADINLKTVNVKTNHQETIISSGFQIFVRLTQPRSCKIRYYAFYSGFSSKGQLYSKHGTEEYIYLESKEHYHNVFLSTDEDPSPVLRFYQYKSRFGSYISINITDFQFNGPNTDNCAYEGFLFWTGDDGPGDQYGPFCGTHYSTKFFASKDEVKNSSPVIHSSTNTLEVFFYSYGLTNGTKLSFNVTVSQCIGLFNFNLNSMNISSVFNYSLIRGQMILRPIKETCFHFQALPSETPCNRITDLYLTAKRATYYHTITHHVIQYNPTRGCELHYIYKFSSRVRFTEFKDYCKCPITARGYLLGISTLIENFQEADFDGYKPSTGLYLNNAMRVVVNLIHPKQHVVTLRAPLHLYKNHHFELSFKCIYCCFYGDPLLLRIWEMYYQYHEFYYRPNVFQVYHNTLPYQYLTAWSYEVQTDIIGDSLSQYVLYYKLKPNEELLPETGSNICPQSGMVQFRRSCYKFYRNTRNSNNTWTDAKKTCEKQGGMLLIIDGKSEMSFIKEMLKRQWIVQGLGEDEPLKQTIYIGLISSAKGDRWIDGTPAAFTEWYRPLPAEAQIFTESLFGKDLHFASPLMIQPNNDPSSKCTAMVVVTPSMPTQWLRIPCQFPYGHSSFICEHRINMSESSWLGNEIQVLAIGTKVIINRTTNLTTVITSTSKCPLGYTSKEGDCFRLVTSTDFINSSMPCSTSYVTCANEMGHIVEDADSFPLELLDIWLHRSEYGNVWVGECNLIIYNITTRTWVLQSTSTDTTSLHARNVVCRADPVSATLVCGPDQFRCNDGTCILGIHRCDGKHHCLHGDDETGCECQGRTFRCQSGQCIPFSKYCDFVQDCKDKSDERNCTYSKCPSHYGQCHNGQCIESYKFGDYKVDCTDASDEKRKYTEGFTCGMFGCYSGECLPKSMVQNMRPDCTGPIKEDESLVTDDVRRGVWRQCQKDPPSDVTKTNVTPYCPMGNGSFTRCRLDHVRCFERHLACVYDDDEYGYMASCPDGDHLRNCRSFECPDMFKCPDSYCIPFHKICNGKPDCPDGEDEGYCNNLSCPGLFKCSTEKICLDQSLVCDGIIHCKDSFDDEAVCSYKKCPFGCLCAGRSVTCTNFTNSSTLDVPFDIRALVLVSTGNVSLRDLHPDWFRDLIYLGQLHIENLGIQSIVKGVFKNLHNLLTLNLRDNLLRSVQKGMFLGLNNLQHLYLSGNPVQSLEVDAFEGLISIKYLHLENLQIKSVADECFRSLRSTIVLSLINNSISSVSSRTWTGLSSLQYLHLEGNNIEQVPSDAFQNLKLNALHTDYFKLCCLAKHVKRCTPEGDAFSSCEELMANSILQVFIWVLGVAAVVGNLAVIIARLITEGKQVISLLIVNLSVSDLLMGVYLLIIASADVTYRGKYVFYADDWRSSGMCKFAGFLSTLSSEMSVFMLVVITADRLMSVVFTFRTKRLSLKTAVAIMATGWIMFSVLSALPVLELPYFGRKYIKNGVCLLFNITAGKSQGWEYSTFVFLLFNMIGFLFLVVSYMCMFWTVNDKRKQAKRDASDKEFELAQRFVLIVTTDFVCWVPLVCTAFVSLWGIPVNPTVSVWMAVIVLPINSALNPFLYTFSALRQMKENWKRKRYRHGSSSRSNATESVNL